MKILKNLKFFVSALLVVFIASCAQNQDKDRSDSEIGKEMKDVKDEVNETLAEEKAELKNEIQASIDNFNEFKIF
jgi:outer membrane lipoprotein-sorting protein